MSCPAWGSFTPGFASGDHHGTCQETALLTTFDLLSSSNWTVLEIGIVGVNLGWL